MSTPVRDAPIPVPEVSLPSDSQGASPALTVVFFDHTAKWSGGEISLFNLVTRLDSRLFRPVVVLFEDGDLRRNLEAEGIATHVIPLEGAINNARKGALGLRSALAPRQVGLVMGHLRALRRVLREENARIVHCNSLKADILGGMASRMAGIPTIWHVRDRIADDYLPARTARLFRALARLIPTQVITNSQATLLTLQLPPNRLQSGRALAIHNGTRLDAFSPCCPPFCHPTMTIGMMGRIAPWKGQHIFLEAAAIVHAQFPDACFQIVGAAMFGRDAEYEAKCRQQSRDLGLENAVEWLGFRSDMPEIVAQMDVLAHASTTGEPFGQVIIEGMAAGKPVVATDGGGVPEIVVEGETGWLVPMNDAPALADALMRLCANPQAARDMGEAGRRRALEHFGIDVTVAKVQTVYQKLIRDAEC